jgi:hypothetical protein
MIDDLAISFVPLGQSQLKARRPGQCHQGRSLKYYSAANVGAGMRLVPAGLVCLLPSQKIMAGYDNLPLIE